MKKRIEYYRKFKRIMKQCFQLNEHKFERVSKPTQLYKNVPVEKKNRHINYAQVFPNY